MATHNELNTGASELIINGKGNIYHLDLGPDDIAHTVITVGDPDRVKEVSKYFDNITHRAQYREFITHTGYIGGKRLTVISTGIGPDNIDIVFNELDALANIDFKTRLVKEKKTVLSIYRLGSCGGLQADMPIDCIVVSSHGLGLDNLLHYYRHDNTIAERHLLDAFVHHCGLHEKGIMPYLTKASGHLQQQFGKGFLHGITVTCPGFYGPQGRSVRLPVAFPGLIDAMASFRHGEARVTNFEMETSAIYGLGKLLGHQCLSISSVIANRATKQFSKDHNRAMDNMIRQSLEIIAKVN